MLCHTNLRRARGSGGCSCHGMDAGDVILEMLARIAIAVTIYLCADENFNKSAPLHVFFNARDHGGVVKGQLRRLDQIFLMAALGGLASLPVSIIIRPVRRQNVVPTHWVRK